MAIWKIKQGYMKLLTSTTISKTDIEGKQIQIIIYDQLTTDLRPFIINSKE